MAKEITYANPLAELRIRTEPDPEDLDEGWEILARDLPKTLRRKYLGLARFLQKQLHGVMRRYFPRLRPGSRLAAATRKPRPMMRGRWPTGQPRWSYVIGVFKVPPRRDTRTRRPVHTYATVFHAEERIGVGGRMGFGESMPRVLTWLEGRFRIRFKVGIFESLSSLPKAERKRERWRRKVFWGLVRKWRSQGMVPRPFFFIWVKEFNPRETLRRETIRYLAEYIRRHPKTLERRLKARIIR